MKEKKEFKKTKIEQIMKKKNNMRQEQNILQ